MKIVNSIIVLFLVVACDTKSDSEVNENMLSKLENFKMMEVVEKNTRKLMEEYIQDVNAVDWKSRVRNYFVPSAEMDGFVKEHTAFRKSFPNYKATIKHMIVEDTQGIVWINVTANYASTYVYDNDLEVVKGIEANGQVVSWDETWHFTTTSEKTFGDQWSYLKDNYKILKDLDIDMP